MSVENSNIFYAELIYRLKHRNVPTIHILGETMYGKKDMLEALFAEEFLRHRFGLKNVLVWDERKESAEAFAKRMKAYTEGR